MYSNRKSNRDSSSANYSRLFLCKVFSQEENSRLFYIMESRNNNNQLWNRNRQLQDDGTVTIGCIFRILAPMVLPMKAPILGTKISAMNNDAVKVANRVIGRNFMNSPTMPGQKRSGMKAASVVAVDAVIGQDMRLAASR